jgi:hypothetical protein
MQASGTQEWQVAAKAEGSPHNGDNVYKPRLRCIVEAIFLLNKFRNIFQTLE